MSRNEASSTIRPDIPLAATARRYAVEHGIANRESIRVGSDRKPPQLPSNLIAKLHILSHGEPLHATGADNAAKETQGKTVDWRE